MELTPIKWKATNGRKHHQTNRKKKIIKKTKHRLINLIHCDYLESIES